MPESAEQSAARRREARGVLQIIAATSAYAAGQMAGADPGLARAAALEAADEMATAATALRRLMRRDGSSAERRSLAGVLASRGQSGPQIAEALGVDGRMVRKYLNGGLGREVILLGQAGWMVTMKTSLPIWTVMAAQRGPTCIGCPASASAESMMAAMCSAALRTFMAVPLWRAGVARSVGTTS